MNLYRYLSKYWRCISHQFALALAGAFVVVGLGCSDFDDSFGDSLVPSSQDSEVRVLRNNTSFSTSLYQSDSIRSSNIGIAVMGAERNLNFGERRGSFFSQFTPVNGLDTDDDDWDSSYPFGYSPMFDSLTLIITLLEYSGDTTVKQKFEVYEALDVEFLNGSADSVYFDTNLKKFIEEDNTLTLTDEPLFTFTFPDQDNEIYINTNKVKLHPYGDVDADNPYGNATNFIKRLLLEDDDADYNMYDWDYRRNFLEKFKGIYIRPADSNTTSTSTDPLKGEGAMYSFYTDGLGLGLYGRNLYGLDIPIIKDTIIMAYSCRNLSAYEIDGDYYGVQINSIERNDQPYTLKTDATELLVEGMGGVVSKITIEEEIFRDIYDEIERSSHSVEGASYNSIFVNQASMKIYLDLSDSELSSPLVITPYLQASPYRLGLYTDYTDYYLSPEDYDDDISTLTGVADYYYEYELHYESILPYNGYMNRSFGYYNMIISSQFQEAWNSYLDAVDDAGGDPDAVNFDDVEERTFYLAPIADNLYTLDMAKLQGMSGGGNEQPISLKLTYTLIKNKNR